MNKNLLRELPSVESVLSDPEISGISGVVSRVFLKEAVTAALDSIRMEILEGARTSLSREDIRGAVSERIKSAKEPSLKRVVNASGTVLHTNLGRSVLSKEAVDALTLAASGTVNLEFDLIKGARGERDSHVEELLKELTGAEAACVVNNNAAAVLISLNALAEGKEVVVSRGELIEIGGSFRLPDVIEKSGCVLKEVGTTNRTHPKDYSAAIGSDTAILFKAHKSNYDIVGFSSEVTLGDMVSIGREHGVPVVEDLGSGSLTDLTVFGLKKEPIVRERISAGADIVTFSGDKLLGGPQAGLIVGKKKYVDMIKKNPLKRALRLDKLIIAALEATLRLYLEPEKLKERLPAIKYLSRNVEEINALALEGARLISARLGSSYRVSVEDGLSQVGSGSLPGYELPTRVIVVENDNVSPDDIHRLFLSSATPILGRVYKERFLLDMRGVDRPSDVCPE